MFGLDVWFYCFSSSLCIPVVISRDFLLLHVVGCAEFFPLLGLTDGNWAFIVGGYNAMDWAPP